MTRTWMGPLQRALIVEDPHLELDELLAKEGFEVVRIPGSAPEEEELIRLLQTHRSHVLFKRSRVPVTRKVVESCPDLFAVQLCCIGDDSVDKQACADHGVLVFNDPVSNGRSVVELVIADLIALSRRLYETDQDCRNGLWEKSDKERYEIQGKVLGIFGLGNIGRAVARAAEALGMQVCFYESRPVMAEVGREMGWRSVANLTELFRSSDCVTCHPSARDSEGKSNAGILTYELLSQLGRDRGPSSPRIFLNLARGFLHSSEDLLQAVAERHIRRAAVDVYPTEPRGKDDPWLNPYRNEPRIALSPHIGASTQEAQPRIARRVAQTLGAFSKWGSLRDCVFNPAQRLGLVEDGVEGRAILVVTHAAWRGSKIAVDNAIYEAGASNLSSAHKDFEALGVAVELAALDQPISEADVQKMIEVAERLTGRPGVIRSVRQVPL